VGGQVHGSPSPKKKQNNKDIYRQLVALGMIQGNKNKFKVGDLIKFRRGDHHSFVIGDFSDGDFNPFRLGDLAVVVKTDVKQKRYKPDEEFFDLMLVHHQRLNRICRVTKDVWELVT
jgi:hypothetical protein